MNQRSQYDFHDQSVVKFSYEQGKIHLVIECFDDASGLYKPVILLFDGVSNITINDEPSATLGMLYDEGEVLRFNFHQNKASLLVEWVDDKNQKRETTVYGFNYATESMADEQT